MPKILLDTDQVSGMAADLDYARQSYASIGNRAFGLSVGVMPPDVVAHVASVTGEVRFGLARVDAGMAAASSELRMRSAAITAADGGGAGLRIPGAPRGLPGTQSGAVGGSASKIPFKGGHAWRSDNGLAEGDVSGEVGATANARASGKFGLTGASGEAHADAFAGMRGSAHGRVGTDMANADVVGSAMAGASASAAASGKLGLTGASADLNANAFAGAQAGIDGKATVSGASASGHASAMAGIGAKGSASASITTSKIKVHLELGVAVGLGGSLGGDVEVDPSKIGHDVAHGAEHLAADGLSHVGGWFR